MRTFLIVCAAVLAASALGLATRYAFSVSFWPANAVLVGLMVRAPRLWHPLAWVGAFVGFIAADMLFGRALELSAWFAGTNLVGSLTAALFLRRLDIRDLTLRRSHSVMRILTCLVPGCLAAGLCGAVLVVVQFQGSAPQALMTWPASELVNYLITLPAILTVRPDWQILRRGRRATSSVRWPVGPAVALALSCVAAVLFDGPGSIMFPMPALLLCALTYSVPTTALLTMALGTGCLTTIGLGIVDIGQDMSLPRMVVSIRIAVAFLVLVPLTITSAMAVRDDLLRQLQDAADHDGLTGLLNRRAFEQRMHDRLTAARVPGKGHVVLWVDIDRFKLINDRYGHPAGDAMLQTFAAVARRCCGTDDLVGRWGGEEFALVVEVPDSDRAAAMADRLRTAFATQTVLWNDVPIRATVSIGAGFLDRAARDVPDLVRQLDEALYRAKHQGRNRVEWLPGTVMASAAMPERTAQA